MSLKRKRPTRIQHTVRCTRCSSALTLSDVIVRDTEHGFAHQDCVSAERPMVR